MTSPGLGRGTHLHWPRPVSCVKTRKRAVPENRPQSESTQHAPNHRHNTHRRDTSITDKPHNTHRLTATRHEHHRHTAGTASRQHNHNATRTKSPTYRTDRCRTRFRPTRANDNSSPTTITASPPTTANTDASTPRGFGRRPCTSQPASATTGRHPHPRQHTTNKQTPTHAASANIHTDHSSIQQQQQE